MAHIREGRREEWRRLSSSHLYVQNGAWNYQKMEFRILPPLCNPGSALVWGVGMCCKERGGGGGGRQQGASDYLPSASRRTEVDWVQFWIYLLSFLSADFLDCCVADQVIITISGDRFCAYNLQLSACDFAISVSVIAFLICLVFLVKDLMMVIVDFSQALRVWWCIYGCTYVLENVWTCPPCALIQLQLKTWCIYSPRPTRRNTLFPVSRLSLSTALQVGRSAYTAYYDEATPIFP